MGSQKGKKKQNAQVTYLPLKISQEYTKDFRECFGSVDNETLYKLQHLDFYGIDEVKKSLELYPVLKDAAFYGDNYSTICFTALFQEWEKYRQVFKLDKDFFSQLIETDGLQMIENVWDYLPFKSFYLDLSSCKEEVSKLCGSTVDGLYINIKKVGAYSLGEKEKEEFYRKYGNEHDFYLVDAISLQGEKTFIIKNALSMPNATMEIEAQDWTEESKLRSDKSIQDWNKKILEKLLFQVISYLSVEKPDIRENEESKHKHKSGVYTPKSNEVLKWEVGYRYGAAFRKWQTENNTKDNEDIENNEHSNNREGKRVRPHFRRGHLHTYLYGKRENPIRKRVWVDITGINIDKEITNELPAVIRKIVPPEKKKDDLIK